MNATDQPGGWTRTRRGRRELAAVALFCTASVLVPLCRTELYPFSRAPMFADAPQQYTSYKVRGADDWFTDELPAQEYGLHRNYWGNPLGVGVGFLPPPSVDRFGEVASREEVIQTVEQAMRRSDYLLVDVIQVVIGPVDDQHIGLVKTNCWRVDNPHLPLKGR